MNKPNLMSYFLRNIKDRKSVRSPLVMQEAILYQFVEYPPTMLVYLIGDTLTAR